MTINLSDPFLGSLFTIFIFTWGLGLAIRIILNPAKLDKEVIAGDPNYLQIRVVWFLRWLFGYRPVTGPVSIVGASFQLAAFLTVGMTAILARIWPDIFHALYWLSIVVLAVMILLARVLMAWLWTKQNSNKNR